MRSGDFALDYRSNAQLTVTCLGCFTSSSRRALERMEGDVAVFREYFEGFDDDFPTLKRHVDSQFELLDTVQVRHDILG